MPTIDFDDQAEGQAQDGGTLSFDEESTGRSGAGAKRVKQSKKVAARKKTVKKRAAKTQAGVQPGAEKKKKAQTTRKKTKPEQTASTVAPSTEAVEAAPAEQNRSEQPVADSKSAQAAPPPSPPQSRGGTGLMGFWLKVGAVAFVILALIIGIYSFFSDDEVTSESQATPTVVGPQGEDIPLAGSVAADTETTQPIVFPLTPQQPNLIELEPLPGNSREPAALAETRAADRSVSETDVAENITPGPSPVKDQPPPGPWGAMSQKPRAGQLYAEPGEYRPELYRPLEPKGDSSPTTQPSAATEPERAASVPVPSQYPQPGTYAYPPSPYYGGYGYYPQPGTYGYPPAPYYGGYGGYYPY